jgi:preprotein translocase subunit YajC
MVTQTTTTQPVFHPGKKPDAPGGGILFLVCLVFVFSIYFQRRREHRRQRLTVSAKKGDTIITFGGIVGTLHEIISEKEVSLKIAKGIYIRVVRGAIANVLEKRTDLEKMSNSDINLCISLVKIPGKRFFPGKGFVFAQEGDKIITFGGIVGTLHNFFGKKEILLEISENTYIRVLKRSISCAFENKTDLGKKFVFGLDFSPLFDRRIFVSKSFLFSLSSFFDEQGR